MKKFFPCLFVCFCSLAVAIGQGSKATIKAGQPAAPTPPTMGSRFVVPVGPFLPQSASINIADPVSAGNKVDVIKFFLPYGVNVGHFKVNITTLSASNQLGVGIYDTLGSLLVRSVAQSTAATGYFTINANAVTLIPRGWYYLAFTSSSTVTRVEGVPNHASAEWTDAFWIGEAANSASAGILPATLGTITNNNHDPSVVTITN